MTNNPEEVYGLPHWELSPRKLAWLKIRRNKMLLFGGSLALLFVAISTLAPLLTKKDPNIMNFGHRFEAPSKEHVMGTDQYGRDVFARILYGAQASFKVGILSVLIGLLTGVLMGAVAGYWTGLVDDLLMRITDALLAFPPLLLAIGLVAAVGPGLATVSVSIGVVYIPRFARVMRSAVLAERSMEYVEAARALGQSGPMILWRHIGPSTVSPVVVVGTIIFAQAVLIEASLSFLGIGLPPPTPSWGAMLDEGRQFLGRSVWMTIFPGAAISLAVLGFNMLGDGLRDFLDPKS